MYVLLVYQLDVLRLPIIQFQVQDITLALYHLRLVEDSHLLVADHWQQAGPLAIAQPDVVQLFQLQTQVLQQGSLILYLGILIPLVCQLLDERIFQLRLTLVALARLWLHLIASHHRLLLFKYDFIFVHRLYM